MASYDYPTQIVSIHRPYLGVRIYPFFSRDVARREFLDAISRGYSCSYYDTDQLGMGDQAFFKGDRT